MLDYSDCDVEQYDFTAATGDVSNWYYRLKVPDEVAEFFVLPKVSAEELRDYLIQNYPEDDHLPDPARGCRLGVCVLVVGW